MNRKPQTPFPQDSSVLGLLLQRAYARHMILVTLEGVPPACGEFSHGSSRRPLPECTPPVIPIWISGTVIQARKLAPGPARFPHPVSPGVLHRGFHSLSFTLHSVLPAAAVRTRAWTPATASSPAPGLWTLPPVFVGPPEYL